MAQGICDTEVPAVVRDAAKAAIDEGDNIYTRLDGIARLRNAVARDWERRRGFPVDPDREVMVTNGATGALYAAAKALLDPGDEAILFEPLYGYHAGTLSSMHVKPVIVPLQYGSWALDMDAVRAAVTDEDARHRHQHAGQSFRQGLLTDRSLRRWPRSRCSTTCSSSATRSMSTSSTPATTTSAWPRCPACASGPSPSPASRRPTASPAGASATWLRTRAGSLPSATFTTWYYICAPSPFQHGCAAGLEQLPPSFYTELASSHLEKREQTVAALTDAGLTPHTPDGAYYILADATPLNGSSAAEKSRDLLARTGVAAVAGSAFFRKGGGENLLRFCFAKRDADLDEACKRLRIKLSQLSIEKIIGCAELKPQACRPASTDGFHLVFASQRTGASIELMAAVMCVQSRWSSTRR